MISRKMILFFGVAAFAGGFLVALAQDFYDYRPQRRSWRSRGPTSIPADRNGVPDWELNKQFDKDVFTFVRIQYDSYGRWGWNTDYPDADLNLSYRLQQLTSMKVHPEGKIMRLTDPELFQHPFIYIIEPGAMRLRDEEVVALRQYLDKGGFLMIDDFWGEREWDNLEYELSRVLPDRDWVDLPLSHEIFHIVYDLNEKPIIPSIHTYYNGWRTERADAQEAHYRAYLDDDDRIMVMICHNTDLGDGWEREGVDRGYFETYSEPFAYPLGINIVTYAMTH